MTGATVPRHVVFLTSFKQENAQVDVTALETTRNLSLISCVQSMTVDTTVSILRYIKIIDCL